MKLREGDVCVVKKLYSLAHVKVGDIVVYVEDYRNHSYNLFCKYGKKSCQKCGFRADELEKIGKL